MLGGWGDEEGGGIEGASKELSLCSVRFLFFIYLSLVVSEGNLARDIANHLSASKGRFVCLIVFVCAEGRKVYFRLRTFSLFMIILSFFFSRLLFSCSFMSKTWMGKNEKKRGKRNFRLSLGKR
jgi:hypothetical protein